MLKAERQRLILEILESNRNVTVSDLCNQFDVSEMTIRRDLSELEQQGLLRRVYGGAIRDLGRSYEPPYQLRSIKNIEAKQAIGKKAAEMVFDGESIALDTGTTTLEIARHLSGVHNLTIITTSLNIANLVVNNFVLHNDVRLILTGGIVRSGELSMIGHIPVNTLQDFHVDKAFIGIGALDLEDGLTEFSMEDALVKRALLKNARERIIVVDGSKFGVVAFTSVCPLSNVHTIITDRYAPVDTVAELKQMGIQLVIADE